MVLLAALGLLLLGGVLLVKGADWFVDGIEDLAKVWGISLLVLGVILAGLEPEEMLTAAIASAQGQPALALGNVIGTNVTMITAALGLSALLSPIRLARPVLRQALLATLVSLLPIILLFSGSVSRVEGVILLLLFVAYTLFLLRSDRNFLKQREELEELEEDDEQDERKEETLPSQSSKTLNPRRNSVLWRQLVKVIGGLLAMLLGGLALVRGAEYLTAALGLSAHAIGATIVSLATAGEMLALAIAAARKHRSDLLVGAILGSFAYNLLVTLGLAALVRPLPVDPHALTTSLPIMLLAHVLLVLLIWRGYIGRFWGVLLLLLYVGYVALVLGTGLAH